MDEPERRAWFVAAAEKYGQNFLKGFTPDGYCSEGIGYYNYGFGHYVLLAETLFQATGGQLDLLDTPLVRQIAQFGPRMEIQPGIYPAFADCSPKARPGRPTAGLSQPAVRVRLAGDSAAGGRLGRAFAIPV